MSLVHFRRGKMGLARMMFGFQCALRLRRKQRAQYSFQHRTTSNARLRGPNETMHYFRKVRQLDRQTYRIFEIVF